jgi:hypothetical protein
MGEGKKREDGGADRWGQRARKREEEAWLGLADGKRGAADAGRPMEASWAVDGPSEGDRAAGERNRPKGKKGGGRAGLAGI